MKQMKFFFALRGKFNLRFQNIFPVKKIYFRFTFTINFGYFDNLTPTQQNVWFTAKSLEKP